MIDNKRPVIQLTLSGEFVAEFPSCAAAAKQFGGKNTDKRIIYDCCCSNRPNRTSRGYKWKFKETKNG